MTCRQEGEASPASLDALEERLESLHAPQWFVAYLWPADVPDHPPAATPTRPYTTIGVPNHASVQPTYWEDVRQQELYCRTYDLPILERGAQPDLMMKRTPQGTPTPWVVPYKRTDTFFWRCAPRCR